MSASPRRRSRSPIDERDSCTGNNLYISNLSYRTDELNLHDEFARYGKIKHCKVIKDPYTGQSRGFGFVTFESPDDAKEARERLSGILLDGRELVIEVAKRSRAYSPTPGNYLGNPKYKRNFERSPRTYRGNSPLRDNRRSPRGRGDQYRGHYSPPTPRASPRRPSRRSPRRFNRSRS